MRLFAPRGVGRTTLRNSSVGLRNSPTSWRKSSYSSYNGNCVEVTPIADDLIGVRDSQNPRGTALNFTPAEWDAFVGGIRSGNFDHRPRR